MCGASAIFWFFHIFGGWMRRNWPAWRRDAGIDRISARHHNGFVIIESIDRQYSSETELACTTAPPLDDYVFQHFCGLLKSTGKLDTVKFREEGGRLYISAASWSPHLRDTIDSFLTSAENASAQARHAHAEKTRLERHKRERAIDAAAKALGVPIK
jgi:hypothetical protein